MSGIVCAVRGGPDSQPTIARSIALAAETGQTIYFLYVVNLDFLSHTATSRVHVVAKEMHQMGEFILLTAQSQAMDQGVQAKAVVRQGQVREEIINLCHDIAAEYVILGRPRGEAEIDVFTHERLDQFTQDIERESGAKAVLADEIS
ncbi:MAG: universal stress protein [Chloroflexi bacterium]|nr:universal stress protein [Chloroflexota bacterium]MBU1660885.1 universal stress protein [Chloroflexota bacterium]